MFEHVVVVYVDFESYNQLDLQILMMSLFESMDENENDGLVPPLAFFVDSAVGMLYVFAVETYHFGFGLLQNKAIGQHT